MNLSRFRIIPAFYNGFCFGLKTDLIYSAKDVEDAIEGKEENVNLKGHLAWILILPFVDLYFFYE